LDRDVFLDAGNDGHSIIFSLLLPNAQMLLFYLWERRFISFAMKDMPTLSLKTLLELQILHSVLGIIASLIVSRVDKIMLTTFSASSIVTMMIEAQQQER
jgi:hypothetical protein